MTAYVQLGRALALLGPHHPLADGVDQLRAELHALLDELPAPAQGSLWEAE